MPRFQDRARWRDRHPRATILLANLAILLVALAGLEIFLRYYLPYNPGYYMAFEQKPGVFRFPYGTITDNSLGFPDDEFNLASTKPRVGYFGDSVTGGVGVGSGYRISDLLEADYPDYEHWTFAMTRDGVDEAGAKTILELANTYDLDVAVYLLNLNDILPSDRFTASGDTWLANTKEKLKWLDFLRGRSYLYTFIRSKIRLQLAATGHGYQGWKAFEMFPSESAGAIGDTVNRINRLGEELARRGVQFKVVLLPYEMQTSEDAARKYWELGVRWEPDFVGGHTQDMLIGDLSDLVQAFDARQAFSAGDAAAAAAKIGQYFVYDRGDKLDWNHPNRLGHQAIARWLVSRNFLDAGFSNQAGTPQ